MFRVKKLRFDLAFVLLATPSVITGAGLSEQQINYYEANESEVETAFQFFSGKSLNELFVYLNEVRPKSSSTGGRQLGLKKLAIAMTNSKIRMSRERFRSFQWRITPVLKLHHVNNLAIVIFEHDNPHIMIHGNSLITVSSRSIELAGSAAGFQGLIAHEVAHIHLSSPQLLDRLDDDSRFGREIELVCDGIAAATLLRLGHDPTDYAIALLNNVLSSDEITRLNSGDMSHPSLPARLKMIRLVSAQFSQTPAARSSHAK